MHNLDLAKNGARLPSVTSNNRGRNSVRQKTFRLTKQLLIFLFAFLGTTVLGQTIIKKDSLATKFGKTLQGTWRHTNTYSSEKGSDNILSLTYFDTLALNQDSSFILKRSGSTMKGKWYIKTHYKKTTSTPYKFELILQQPPGLASYQWFGPPIFPQLKDDKTFFNDISSFIKKKKMMVVEYYSKIN